MKIEQVINSLPPAARTEVLDFVAFLEQKYGRKKSPAAKEDASYWAALGETSFRKIWDNKEDDIYNICFAAITFFCWSEVPSTAGLTNVAVSLEVFRVVW